MVLTILLKKDLNTKKWETSQSQNISLLEGINPDWIKNDDIVLICLIYP